MTGEDMDSSEGMGSRGALGRWIWILAALLIPAVLAAGRSAGEESEPRSDARDAVAILLDNQDRCLQLSYGRLDILEAHGSDERTQEMEHFLSRENRTEVRVARNAVGIARRLASGLGAEGTPEVSRAIQEMLDSQKSLCDRATDTHSWGDLDDYRRQIREQSTRFERALSSLPFRFQLNSAERQALVRKYRGELYAGGDDDIESLVPGAVEQDRDPLADRPISDEEYQRKKEAYDEWLLEQQRRDAERIRQQAKRREEVRERRRNGPREMPKLEYKVPREPEAPEPAAVSPDAMARWHADYSTKIAPFKKSLSSFLKVQGASLTLIMEQACQDLARVAGGVLEDPAALEAPDAAVSEALRAAVTQFKQASSFCIAGRLQRTRVFVAAGEQDLVRAMNALKSYGLGL